MIVALVSEKIEGLADAAIIPFKGGKTNVGQRTLCQHRVWGRKAGHTGWSWRGRAARVRAEGFHRTQVPQAEMFRHARRVDLELIRQALHLGRR
jgi:hypothetical protein